MADNTPLQTIRFGRAICNDLAQAERREWWLSNGKGAYASGNIAGSLTRRYHGLLIAPMSSTLDRHLLLAKADPWLEIDGLRYPLFVNRWLQGDVESSAINHIEAFYLDGELPVWIFAVQGLRFELRIWMEAGVHATWVAMRPLTDLHHSASIRLHMNFLANMRDHHGMMSSGGFHPDISTPGMNHVCVAYGNDRQLHIQTSRGQIQADGHWINNFLLLEERRRGLSEVDNHLQVAHAVMDISDAQWLGIRAALTVANNANVDNALKQARQRQNNYFASVRNHLRHEPPTWIRQLILSARSFIFQRPMAEGKMGKSIIAGYPWFGDWGRDTMIALPGLTLVTGLFDTAGQILETFGRYVDRGMIPNRFPEYNDQPEYNTVDAALWYILAWHAYIDATGDIDALKRNMPALRQIIDNYSQGTRYRIHRDPEDGLIYAGEAGSQLTWMDAKVGEWVVTPRIGKPVEINALWYNALCALSGFCQRLGQDPAYYQELATEALQGFQRFIKPAGGLIDVLDGPQGDEHALRPNQLFALSLPWQLVDKVQADSILNAVGRHLYTSYGLRSLAPDSEAYQGRYRGGVRARDGAYHQGTVWSWLLGHYVMALYRTNNDAEQALALLEPIRDHLQDAGLGTISEIFDGDEPHLPCGTPSQAWSVATVLEAWWLIKRSEQ